MDNMITIVIPYLLDILATAAITLIGIAGSWAALKLSQQTQLVNITQAVNQVVQAAQITVRELNQTVVEGLKAGAADGKLTEAQIRELQQRLLDQTMDKLSAPVVQLLEASRTDINAIIRGAGEALINGIK